MSDPFEPLAMNAADRFHAMSGMIDYWITPTVHDSTPNILDKDGAETVGVAIRVDEAATVAYKDRHGTSRSAVLPAGGILPTSVGQILDTGTDAVTVYVAIAP